MKVFNTKFILLLFTAIGIFFSCHPDDITDNSMIDCETEDCNSVCKKIIIDESLYDGASRDDFIFKEAKINNDTLILTIQYGGGCGITNFELLTEGYFMESNPVQLDILLSFNDDDPCEALLQKEICFDITKLATLYNDSYLSNGGTIILRIQGYPDNLEYIF